MLFFIALLAFFSPPLSSFPALSALRFWPAAAAVLTQTSVDLPCPPDASFATCASAALQSADASLIAYLSGPARRHGQPTFYVNPQSVSTQDEQENVRWKQPDVPLNGR